jgi:hypothetical protein
MSTAETVEQGTHYSYLHDIVDAAREVGAYIVAYGPGDETAQQYVTLAWPGKMVGQITVESYSPAMIIRRLPDFST